MYSNATLNYIIINLWHNLAHYRNNTFEQSFCHEMIYYFKI
jgi:hypothetical protein